MSRPSQFTILPSGIESRCTWYRRLNGAQVRPGRVDEQKFLFHNRVRIPGRSPCSESLYCYVLPVNCLIDCNSTEYEMYAFVDCLSVINFSYRRTHELLMWDFFLNNQPDAPFTQIYTVIKLYMFRAPSLIPGVFCLMVRIFRLMLLCYV